MFRKKQYEASVAEGVDKERMDIRSELSTLSFEELQQLKERMGAREYKRAFFGESARHDPGPPREFKRENKNRPREMSSKRPVSMISEAEKKKKKKEVRDPRFDPLCGDYDKKTFEENYSFVDELRGRDMAALKAELKECQNPRQRETIKLLLQRLTNQAREKMKNKKRKEKIPDNDQLQDTYISKSERRVKGLVEQYEELRQSGKLKKHIERRQKKVTQKAKKRQLAPPT